jgi:glutamine amidotransferase-like uncharacterized protein
MTRKQRPRVAVFVNHPECSIQSAHGIIRALSFNYDVFCFGREEISDQFFKRCHIIAFPGGIGDSDTWHRLLAPTQDVIHNQIARGKRYLGICMGAYWAGPHYYNILDGVNPVQYIKRPDADVRRSFATTVPVHWINHDTEMFFYDGCSLIGKRRNFDIIAQYSNGDPAAIIQNRIGLIGPHPESDIYWYQKPYMQPYWHEYYHHTLLLDFANELMKR